MWGSTTGASPLASPLVSTWPPVSAARMGSAANSPCLSLAAPPGERRKTCAIGTAKAAVCSWSLVEETPRTQPGGQLFVRACGSPDWTTSWTNVCCCWPIPSRAAAAVCFRRRLSWPDARCVCPSCPCLSRAARAASCHDARCFRSSRGRSEPNGSGNVCTLYMLPMSNRSKTRNTPPPPPAHEEEFRFTGH